MHKIMYIYSHLDISVQYMQAYLCLYGGSGRGSGSVSAVFPSPYIISDIPIP